MDTKVIYWIAITIVILLIIVAFWSERGMFFKKKERKEEKDKPQSKYKVVRNKDLLISKINLIIEFLEDFAKEGSLDEDGNIDMKTCGMLHNIVIKMIKEQCEKTCNFNEKVHKSGLADDFMELKFLFDCWGSGKEKESVLRKLKRIRINILNNDKY